jgi:NDP-sugar pyrophosphorylase family protein
MKAIILAAGVGSRLDPLTRTTPKPLVPIVNRPVMEHLIDLLRNHGFVEIAVNVHYLADDILKYFNDGSKWGVKLQWIREKRLWGDAGSIKRLGGLVPGESLLAIGCDDLTSIDISSLVEFHQSTDALVTMAITEVDDPSQYGVVVTDKAGRVVGFQEKPVGGTAISNCVNTGIYVFRSEVMAQIPPGIPFLLGKDLLPQLIDHGHPVYGFSTTAYWRDIGTLSSYRQAHTDVLNGCLGNLIHLPETRIGVWIAEDAVVDPSATLLPPVVVGNNCRVGAGVRLSEGTVLGSNCVVDAGATLKSSILWENCHVVGPASLVGCILASNCALKTEDALFGAIICNNSQMRT